MEYVAEIQADLNGYPSSEKLILKQGDEGMRYVIVALLNNGVPVSIGADVTPRVAMTKPDGKQILTDDNIEVLEDGTLKIKVIAQMTVAAGAGIMEIGLYKQGAHLSTAVFGVYVYPNALSMIKVASSNEYQALIDALGQVAPAIDAEKERLISEDERRASEAERKENEIIRQAALERCIEASAHAEAQGNYAKNQGDYAKEQGNYAKEQGDYAKAQGNYAGTQGAAASAATKECKRQTTACESATQSSINQTAECKAATEAAIEAATGHSMVYDPVDGSKKTAQETFENIWKHMLSMFASPITVDEFDALGLTVDEFDALKLTVYEFDTRAKAILMGGEKNV